MLFKAENKETATAKKTTSRKMLIKNVGIKCVRHLSIEENEEVTREGNGQSHN